MSNWDTGGVDVVRIRGRKVEVIAECHTQDEAQRFIEQWNKNYERNKI